MKLNNKFTTPCILWTGRKNHHNYGLITKKHVPKLVHRLMWESVNGPIPKGIFVLHKCDVRHCINPDHLFLGTHQDNMNDMKAKGRSRNGNSGKTCCLKGHEFSKSNTAIYYRKDGSPSRQCKICIRDRGEKYRASKRNL